jgi:hypothetical protein
MLHCSCLLCRAMLATIQRVADTGESIRDAAAIICREYPYTVDEIAGRVDGTW